MSRTDRLGADAECDQRRLSQFSADQTGMTDPLAEIKTRLQRYPQLRFKERRGTICVSPEGEDGFPVSFHQHGDEFVVAFAGWHEHFTEVDSALACFAFGLSDAARLKVYSRCGFDYK